MNPNTEEKNKNAERFITPAEIAILEEYKYFLGDVMKSLNLKRKTIEKIYMFREDAPIYAKSLILGEIHSRTAEAERLKEENRRLRETIDKVSQGELFNNWGKYSQ